MVYSLLSVMQDLYHQPYYWVLKGPRALTVRSLEAQGNALRLRWRIDTLGLSQKSDITGLAGSAKLQTAASMTQCEYHATVNELCQRCQLCIAL